MSKKKRKSLDVKDLMNKVKPLLDINEWKKRFRFKSENVKRIVSFYTLVAGIVIIGITFNTVISQTNTSYPLNLTATESIRSEINSARNVKNQLEESIHSAQEYYQLVEEQKVKIEDIERYLPSVVDPLSLMVHVERIAQSNNVTITKLILPSDRSLLDETLVPTDDEESSDEESIEENEENSEAENSDNPVENTSGDSLIGSNIEQNPNAVQNEESEEEEKVKTRKPIVDDMAYVVDITVIGKYSNLAGFFEDLENTREIIEIANVKISEYQPEGQEESYVDINNFDMDEIITQIDFQIKLYDKRAFVDFMFLDDIVIEPETSNEEEEVQ